MKKLLIFIVDALTSRVITPLIESGEFSNLAALKQRGYFSSECASIFPSITHACLSSIATGNYPRQHGVLGSHWFVREKNEVAYYGVGPNIILNEGVEEFIEDAIYKLNHERLEADTFFQKVEQHGLEATCINFLIFRGDVKHQFSLPFPIGLMPTIEAEREVYGPKNLLLGDFVQQSTMDLSSPDLISNPGSWYGFKDENAFDWLNQLAEDRSFSDFTLAYFPLNDFISHDEGPEATVENLRKIDEGLGKMLVKYGGIDAFLNDFYFVFTGDHSHDSIRSEPSLAMIELDEILEPFALAEVGKGWDPEDEIMVCTNMRSAYLYFRNAASELFDRVVEKMLPDDRIDLIIWKAAVRGEGKGYKIISTVGEEPFQFWRTDETGENTAVDQHNNRWGWNGNLACVDAKVEDGTLHFHNYPNAFERIEGVLESKDSGDMILSAAPGFEFKFPNAATHAGGGSHGSLHRTDSIVPLLVAGAPDDFEFPANPRIVDVSPICLSLLGIESS